MSGVSIRSLRPYLCGLSSGNGEGAGMLGDKTDPRLGGGGGESSRWRLESLLTSGCGLMPSIRDCLRLSTLESRIVVDALRGRSALSSVIVTVDAECTTCSSLGDLDGGLPSMNGSMGLSSFSSLTPSKVVGETCCCT